MTGEFSSAGDIATGALVARAVESNAGEHAAEGAGGVCRNCGTLRVGEFCHQCGQTAQIHNTLGSIGHDLLHGVFHFEGKIWHTIPMLVMRPGELTRRYIAGERARFVSPLAIFLFTVFLMFAVVAQLPSWSFPEADMLKAGGIADARTRLANERAAADRDLTEARQALAKELADPGSDPSRPDRLRDRIKRATEGRDALAKAVSVLPKAVAGSDDAKAEAPPGNWFEAKFQHARENPELLIYKVKTSAYKYSWALIPLSLPFVWLLFPLRRNVGLYDHAIFATYSLTFMSLLVILLALLVAIGLPDWIAWTAAVFVPPFHIYKQLKYAYGLSRFGAVWRTFWMINFAAVALVLFVLLLLWLGVAD